MADAAPEGVPATAEDVIRSVILTAAERLTATLPDAVQDVPDGVHQHRTSVRRLRSVLAAFRDYLDEPTAHDLRVQFAEWGLQLGVVRDVEVRADVAAAAMDDLGIDDAAMRARLVDAEHDEYLRAHARLRELADGPRSAARIAALEQFAAAPSTTEDAGKPPERLTRVARHEARRVRKAAKRSDGSIESLHDVRKAGRRLRYVGEALHEAAADVFGDDFEELAAAGEGVHDALGSHRDELIFIERLELARVQAGRAGEGVEHYDALIARSSERAEKSLAGLDEALDRVRAAAAAL